MTELTREAMVKALTHYTSQNEYTKKALKGIDGIIQGIKSGLLVYDPMTEKVDLSETGKKLSEFGIDPDDTFGELQERGIRVELTENGIRLESEKGVIEITPPEQK